MASNRGRYITMVHIGNICKGKYANYSNNAGRLPTGVFSYEWSFIMTATQKDLSRRVRELTEYLYESEVRQLSDAIGHGKYYMAYSAIKEAERRCRL